MVERKITEFKKVHKKPANNQTPTTCEFQVIIFKTITTFSTQLTLPIISPTINPILKNHHITLPTLMRPMQLMHRFLMLLHTRITQSKRPFSFHPTPTTDPNKLVTNYTRIRKIHQFTFFIVVIMFNFILPIQGVFNF